MINKAPNTRQEGSTFITRNEPRVSILFKMVSCPTSKMKEIEGKTEKQSCPNVSF